ncbi:Kinesin-like protein KIN-4C [Vitis vinifera]|uniref:Kinesin-like protein KIN-4C n=1 Tax=Vitis vinifera TaxID=29760 RepID=A0A438G015_VITVI|nr:Kinesin-like protein KIN-4C [Vitis vinifera]
MKKASEKRVHELELKNKALQTEVEELRNSLANVSVASDDGVRKIKENYLQKLNDLEEQVGELKKKLEAQSQLLIQKQKHVEAAKQLHYEIQRIKAQKVQLQWSMKKQSVQFRLCKAALEKEILQLKTEGRRNEYKMHKLLALNQGQKMVLQRKTQEASMATKWLKELLESRKSWLHEKSSARDANGRIQAMEHEHDLSVRLQELYSEYEHQLEVRAGIAVEIVNLKEEAEMLKHKNLRCLLEEEEDDCREKDSEIRDLNKMVVELSGLVRQLEMEKAEFIHKEKSQNILQKKQWKEDETNSGVLIVNIMKEIHVAFPQGSPTPHQHYNYKKTLGSQSATSLSCTVSDSDFQDMDVSEPEYSNMKAAEINWIDSGKQATEKSNSDSGAHSSGTGSNLLSTNDSERLKTGTPVEEHADVTGKTGSKGCCSCSKKSLCKTLKCKCRATNGSCGTSCGCAPTKCTNRDTDLFGTGASHSALLLHTALVVKPAEKNSNCAPRGKALSDIGNTLIKAEEQKPNQLVPLAPPSLHQENTRALKKPENSATDTDIDSMSPIYAESNAIKPDKFVTKKAGRPATRRSKKVAE